MVSSWPQVTPYIGLPDQLCCKQYLWWVLSPSEYYLLCNPPVVWLWESVRESPSSLHQKCPLLLVTMGVATVSPRHCPLQLHCSQPDSQCFVCVHLCMTDGFTSFWYIFTKTFSWKIFSLKPIRYLCNFSHL